LKKIYEKLEKRYGTEKIVLFFAIANIVLKTLALAVIFFIMYLCFRCWV